MRKSGFECLKEPIPDCALDGLALSSGASLCVYDDQGPPRCPEKASRVAPLAARTNNQGTELENAVKLVKIPFSSSF